MGDDAKKKVSPIIQCSMIKILALFYSSCILAKLFLQFLYQASHDAVLSSTSFDNGGKLVQK